MTAAESLESFATFLTAVAAYSQIADRATIVDYLDRGLNLAKADEDLGPITLEVTSAHRKALEQQIAEGKS